MVQIKEFRIVMPMSLDEYEIAQLYMVLKMQQESTTNTEGVDVLESRPVEDDHVSGKGHYTSKLYRFDSKVPSWISAFAPADTLHLKEEAWNAFPKCKSVIQSPSFSKLLLTIETVHVADNGTSQNVHGLTEEQLAIREVEVIDIGSSVRDYWSYLVGYSDMDVSELRSKRANRGPLPPGWRDKCSPVMTAYKLVTVDAPYWGYGKRLEHALLAGERALFLETHRNMFAWMDDWYGMTIKKLRKVEHQLYSSSNQGPTKSMLVNTKDGFDRRCSLESEEDAYTCNLQPKKKAISNLE